MTDGQRIRVGLVASVGPRFRPEDALVATTSFAVRPWIVHSVDPADHGRSSAPPRTNRAVATLTNQEREVARLAASGLTNADIGRRLLVSHRTVGAHLRAVFAKLDVATRASLPDALADTPVATDVLSLPRDAVVRANCNPRELQVALLAAQGLTNKQIAERLYLSHRTVAANLYRIYPKLGIRSRSSLRGALRSLATG